MATPTLNRSTSRGQTPPPRPTTPLRPPSRSSLRSSYTPGASYNDQPHESAIASLEPAFAELSDSMADLEANFVHLQLLHESVSRFNECFAAFLYGLNVNAFCVETPEAPVPESFKRARGNPAFFAAVAGDRGFAKAVDQGHGAAVGGGDVDQTFMTSDTSFVENPPTTVTKSSVSSRGQTAGRNASTRGSRGSGVPRGPSSTRGTTGRGRASGLARPRYGGRGGYR